MIKLHVKSDEQCTLQGEVTSEKKEERETYILTGKLVYQFSVVQRRGSQLTAEWNIFTQIQRLEEWKIKYMLLALALVPIKL